MALVFLKGRPATLPRTSAATLTKIFYGWRIVTAGCAIQFLQSMLLSQAYGAYLAALVEERAWSKAALSGAAAMGSTEAALFGPALGWMVDRYGSQVVIRIGMVTFAIGFMLLSQVDSLQTFYAAFLVLALGQSMASLFPISVAIIQWFERHRARALSALQFGSALGGLFVVVVASSIQTFGWRATAFGSGVVILLFGFPLAGVISSRPEERGETVDGLPPEQPGTGQVASSSSRAFTAREAIRTSAFWLISLGHGFSLLVVTAMNVHAINHLKEGLGYSLAHASLVFSFVTIGQVLGVGLGGLIGDRYEKRLVAAGCMLTHAFGLLLLAYSTALPVLAAAALVHGTAWGLRGPFMNAIRADYFGRRSIGMIIGISSLITVVGQIAGPLVAGGFADWTGDYRAGFTLLALLAGLGSFFFFFLRPPKLPA